MAQKNLIGIRSE